MPMNPEQAEKLKEWVEDNSIYVCDWLYALNKEYRDVHIAPEIGIVPITPVTEVWEMTTQVWLMCEQVKAILDKYES